MTRIGRAAWAAALLLWLGTGAWLLAMGRPPICTCGHVALWHGALDAGNSQHIADWYSLSHVIHGFLFFGAGWLLLRRWVGHGWWLVAAVAVEGAWELLENSPAVIQRYREATIALGYSGDSVLNSMADIAWMTVGFLIARALPWRWTVAAGIVLELAALAAVRDNLTLNVLMLVHPSESVRIWQAG